MRDIPRVLVLVGPERGVGRRTLRGIAKYSYLQGPWLFYRKPPFYVGAADRRRVVEDMKRWNPQGVILIEHQEKEAYDDILAMDLPTIVSFSSRPELEHYPTIVADNIRCGEMAAQHLLDRNLHHFAFAGVEGMTWSQDRLQGFRSVIEGAGNSVHAYGRPLRRRSVSWSEEQRLLAQWLQNLPRPVGLMAVNDDYSEIILELCRQIGLRVPDDIAIIGSDNEDMICDLTHPPLSSVAFNFERAGYEVAALLDRLMRGQETMNNQHIVVQATHVMARASTDVMAVEDPDVVQAMRFIRDHAKQSLQVNDVVESVTLSRRVLEKRFRRALGRGISEEIRNVRTQQVIRMLVETHFSVSDIAEAMGFPGVKHFARSFRQETGMSPLAYRKQYGIK